jgi:hypothetical protein
MESGNRKHRYTYSGGIKAVEESKHGRATAFARYGKPQYFDGAPPSKGSPFPKDSEGRPGAKNFNDVPQNSWLRGAGDGKPRR